MNELTKEFKAMCMKIKHVEQILRRNNNDSINKL